MIYILAKTADVNIPFNWPDTAQGWLILFLAISLVVAGFFSAMSGWVKKAGSGPKNTALLFVVLLIALFVAAARQG